MRWGEKDDNDKELVTSRRSFVSALSVALTETLERAPRLKYQEHSPLDYINDSPENEVTWEKIAAWEEAEHKASHEGSSSETTPAASETMTAHNKPTRPHITLIIEVSSDNGESSSRNSAAAAKVSYLMQQPRHLRHNQATQRRKVTLLPIVSPLSQQQQGQEESLIPSQSVARLQRMIDANNKHFAHVSLAPHTTDSPTAVTDAIQQAYQGSSSNNNAADVVVLDAAVTAENTAATELLQQMIRDVKPDEVIGAIDLTTLTRKFQTSSGQATALKDFISR